MYCYCNVYVRYMYLRLCCLYTVSIYMHLGYVYICKLSKNSNIWAVCLCVHPNYYDM